MSYSSFQLRFALLFVGACTNEQVNKPMPVDMAPLAARYDAPSGTLNPNTARQVLGAALATTSTLAQLGIDETFVETLNDAIDAKQDGEPASFIGIAGAIGTHRQRLIEGEGYLVVRRICPGFGAEPVPDPENGNIELTVGFTESAIDATITGSVTLCRQRVQDRGVVLRGFDGGETGEVNVYLGEPIPFAALKEATMLFDLDIVGEISGRELVADFDFRISDDGETFEIRVPTDEGDLIAITTVDVFSGVRAANGVFGCDRVRRTCVAGSQSIGF